ncbi:hypothetical protein JGH11_18345 [Dysgonomonas sp. Marseille-P4677]|uniref:hypothetical protein n=1 Tax=Dysgonomonas sp. Marseille-P4677 TaxID=2364790 RepID=UPI0019120C83|nr:hypothetical protein [Dysgonomonas sp. Marseille-P4677]MBK5722836.1 hypothetical protein [Dysgonomonas sp. Marseille-P4677]
MRKNIYVMILLLVIFYLKNDFCYSQSSTQPVDLLQPSPDAAALGKYGTYPVSLNTGLVNIDIPIYTVSLPLITLPISISYHPSGIKVDDISSMVGLGWSLNVGGVITRSTKGSPDNINNPTAAYTPMDADKVFALGKGTRYGELSQYCSNSSNNLGNFESDIFNYNAGGLSGSFRFDKSGKIIQIPLSNNKIEILSSGDFKITGNDGTIYLFKDKEEGMQAISNNRVTTSWYLSSITTVDGNYITFSYGTDTTPYYDYYPSYSINIPQNSADINKIDNAYLINNIESMSYQNKTLFLNSIEFPEGKIAFNYLYDRLDKRKYRLSEIFLSNKSNTIKSYFFQHGYFSNTDSRLKLDRLFVRDAQGQNSGSYDFHYNTMNMLPPYYKGLQSNSLVVNQQYFGQDYWGFYNGERNNKCLLKCSADEKLKNVNRDISEEHAQAYILNKIVYPTGGYTEFEYESNMINKKYYGGLRIKTVKSYSTAGSKPTINSYEYLEGVDNTLGTILHDPYTRIKIEEQGINQYYYLFDIYSTESASAHSAIPSVYYTKVVEYNGYPNNCNGKSEYFFTGGDRDLEFYRNYGVIPSFISAFSHFYMRLSSYVDNRNWTRGQLCKTNIYSFDNNKFSLTKSIVNNYTTFNLQDINVGFKIVQNTVGSTIKDVVGRTPEDYYQYSDILTKTGLIKLTKTEEVSYDNNDSVKKITNYHYDNIISKNFYEITRIENIDSKGATVKKTLKYPIDKQSSTYDIYKIMCEQNALTPVLEQITSVNDNHLQSISNTYKKVSSDVLVPWYTDVKNDANAYEREFTYLYDTNYNNGRNIIEIQRKNNTSETYIWGYNATLPVAKINNTSYATIYGNSTLMGYLNKLQDYSDLSNISTCTNLETLNSTIRKNMPTNTLIETYTYNPLVGITSKTDAAGITIYYIYDNIGRLKEIFQIENGTKKILKAYDYHYYEK